MKPRKTRNTFSVLVSTQHGMWCVCTVDKLRQARTVERYYKERGIYVRVQTTQKKEVITHA